MCLTKGENFLNKIQNLDLAIEKITFNICYVFMTFETNR